MSDVVADLVIADLARRVVDLEATANTYRELAFAAIDMLYGHTVAAARQRQRYERLLADYRAARLRSSEAA
jgi:hypothetical protein